MADPARNPATLIDVASDVKQITGTLGVLGFHVDHRLDLARVQAALGQGAYDAFLWSFVHERTIASLVTHMNLGPFEAIKQRLITEMHLSPDAVRDLVMTGQDSPAYLSEGFGPKGEPILKASDHFWPMKDRLPASDYEGRRQVVIAHLDTGVTHHPCLAHGLLPGHDFIAGGEALFCWSDGNPIQYVGDHGTATASTIIGSMDLSRSNLQVFGMTVPKDREIPGNFGLRPCRVASTVGITPVDLPRVVEAIDWAVDQGCRVITMSMGSEGLESYHDDLREAARRAHDAGVIFCAAAGQGVPFMLFPASYSRKRLGELVICCGPATVSDTPWGASVNDEKYTMASWWSTWDDDYVTICAPATKMPKAKWADGAPCDDSIKRVELAESEGTSYATAVTAGCAALWLARNEKVLDHVRPDEVVPIFRRAIIRTAKPWPSGHDRAVYGPGVLNPTALLTENLGRYISRGLASLCAASHGVAGRGAQLWGVEPDGAIGLCTQETPGALWGPWQGDRHKPPKDIVQIVASRNGARDGRLGAFALDRSGVIHSQYQQAGSHAWTDWHRPFWSHVPNLKRLCAVSQGGTRGQQLWGITPEGKLMTAYQLSAGKDWTQWGAFALLNEPDAFTHLTGATTDVYDGPVRLFGISGSQTLVTTEQQSAGGNWMDWSDGGWNSTPILADVCAVPQGGGKGLLVLAVTVGGALIWAEQNRSTRLWTRFQAMPGMADVGSVKHVMATTQGADDSVYLFVVDQWDRIHTNRQTTPGGVWAGWSWLINV